MLITAKTKQFINFNNQQLQLNYINQLTKIIGNDLVLKGMDVDCININNTAQANVSIGLIIQDSIIIEFVEEHNLILHNIHNFDIDGNIVIYVQFQNLQNYNNTVKIGITYIDQQGNSWDNWNHDNNRLVLNYYKINDDYSLIENENPFIVIENKTYYKYGYSTSNISLTRYLSKFIEDYLPTDITPSPSLIGSSPPNILADGVIARGDMLIQDDLTVQDNLIVGGSFTQNGPTVSFDGTLYVNNDIFAGSNFKQSGQYFYSNVTNFEISPQKLVLNRNETGQGTSSRYSGLVIDRGSLKSAVLFFDEETDNWMIGIDGETYQSLLSGDISTNEIRDWISSFIIQFNNNFNLKTTDDLNEGINNKYYSSSLVKNDINSYIVGDNITITTNIVDNKLVITAIPNTDIQIPIASETTLGGIKVGNGLKISDDGILSTDLNLDIPIASSSNPGIIQPGETLKITTTGILDINPINWNDIINKPTTFTPSEHTHDDLYELKNNNIQEHINNDIIHVTQDDKNYWNSKFDNIIASRENVGVIKVGKNLSIESDGTLNAYQQSLFMNIDGGKADSIYNFLMNIDGGDAREEYLNNMIISGGNA